MHNIMEEIEFFYNKFFYDKNVLVPRLETESLVREAIRLIKENDIKTLIDVGTGSGIIPISIELNLNLETGLKIYAVEKSKKAIKMAILNKERLSSKTDFIQGDLLKPIILRSVSSLSLVLITANLPYIKQDDWENMSPDTRFEPKMALFGGKKTGFELYERFFRQIKKLKKTYKGKIFVLCEIGFDQKEVASEFLLKNGFDFYFLKDLRGIDRIIRIEIL